MTNYLVFREEGRNKNSIIHCYEHNERTAAHYINQNIDMSLSGHNFYYKKPTGTYQQMLQEKLDSGQVSTKGLKPDANLYSEVLVAVNRDYWADKSEEYIKKFFQTVYDYLVIKFGEENILSAVVHADEVSEGKINYHLHCVAIPVVAKERYYTKRSKEYRELAQKVGEENIKPNDKRLLKNTEQQISHSKFFDNRKDEHTKKMIYSYAIWQDELTDSLKKAGFDVERGTEGNKAMHLHPNQYKQLMERIEYQAKDLLPAIKAEHLPDGKLAVDEKGYNAMMTLHKQVAKEKAAYDMAVVALKDQQDRLNGYQHNAYCTDDYDELLTKADKLKKENAGLKAKMESLLNQLFTLAKCVSKIFEVASSPYSGGCTLEEFKQAVRDYIKSEMGSPTHLER